MTWKILTDDRKKVVRRLEKLAGKKAKYTRIPRMAFLIEGIAVERDGTVRIEDGNRTDLIEALVAEGMIEAVETCEQDGSMEETGRSEETPEIEGSAETEDNTVETAEVDEDAEITGPEEPDPQPESEGETGRDESGVDASESENTPAEVCEGSAEEADTAICEEQTESEAESEPETLQAVKPDIRFPLSEHRPESIINLVCTMYSRGSLLSKSTGGVFNAKESLVERLRMTGGSASMDEVLRMIREEDGLEGLTFSEDEVSFSGYPETSDPEAVKAWMALSTAINQSAIRQIHVRAKEVDDSNEKFAFRTWLTRIGMNGPELKAERNILYRNLSGHTAFRTAMDEERWKARQAARRAEMKARKEAQEPTQEERVSEERAMEG